MKTFVPLHNILLVKPDKPDELSHGGIVIPDIAKETPVWGTVLAFGQFIKKIGDGAGNILSDTYVMSGGVFTKPVEAKTNVEGETDQSIALYTMKFANAPRALT